MDPATLAILATLVAANSGLWRVIDRYITRHERCGNPRCKEFVMRTCTPLNASVTIGVAPGDGISVESTNSSQDNRICPEMITDNRCR